MNDRTLKVFRARGLCAAALLYLLLAATANAGSDATEITDLADKLRIERVDDYFKVDGKVIICVVREGQQKSFWNPNEHTFSSSASDCKKPPGARPAIALVGFAPVAGMKLMSSAVISLTSFSNAKGIYLDSTLFGHCGPILSAFYTVKYKNDTASSFYIITRLKTTHTLSLPNYCVDEMGKPLSYSFEFDEIALLNSLVLADGRTLLVGSRGDAVEPIVLAVGAIPKTVWSSNGNVFLIPRDLLGPRLEAAGGNPLTVRDTRHC